MDATEQFAHFNITDTSQGDFTSGINNLTNATASPGNVTLANDTSSSATKYFSRGNFTSRIFNATGLANWTNISFATEVPYQRDLEDLKNASTILLLHFNNNTAGDNDSKFVDSSQYMNNGTCTLGTNCPVYNKTNVKLGRYSMWFDVNAVVTLGTGASLRGMKELTVETWINWDGNSAADQRILNYGSNNYLIYIVGTTSTITLNINNADTASYSPIPKNQWFHLALTKDTTSGTKIYINGILAATNSGGTATISNVGDDVVAIGAYANALTN